MRRPLIVILLFFASCQSTSEAEKLHRTLAGNWLIISPDHNLQEGSQYKIYSQIQDSIVGLMGLKLIKFSDDGTFRQLDSITHRGRWGITADNIVFVERGGKGFDNFSAHYSDFNDDMLDLVQFVEAEGEKIELTWHLKKITGSYVTKLFDADKNEWRKKPNDPESEKQIKQRLSAMLQYYSDYYKLVTRESEFFISRRVILPFKFYQHAIGMKSFEEDDSFAQLFFDRQQAQQAWQYLKWMLSSLSDHYPRKKDFLEEYSEFMGLMAEKFKDPA